MPTTNVLRAAQGLFGFDELRPDQEEAVQAVQAVQAVLAGRDTLAAMPTGSGKPAIYELATRSAAVRRSSYRRCWH